ncbi:MAG: FHA domain-containing protein [Acidobacteriota bacterium]
MSDQKSKTSDFALRVEAGVDRGKVFPLLTERMAVGRSNVADIEIHEVFAARRHFEIIWVEETRPHGIRTWSINAVFINGVELDRNADSLKMLKEGDLILLGDTVFVYDRLTDK